ncbi:MAG: outer membrane lipoprotein-sorting protein [Calditrichaeota bacterium]|nr:MAG: outer membrane lipoprotein-sorting protein [Calditrichota bacterium]MBL1206806.1 outer membrane lipoprotein-sorting protein [Calditrichota bacterium]NOG46634.1 outer membrane lipoprotein-sorting protein [Calditrichota bacterium]
MITQRINIHILLLAFSTTLLFSQESALDIVKKSNDLIRSKSSYAEFKMIIIKPDWSREVAMKVWSIEPDYSLLLVTAPARDKGMVTLKRKQEVWNFIPSVQKTIKIPPSMMLQSWMGSDFTNDDLVRQSSIVEDYQHQVIGEEEYEGYLCHKVELIPNPEAGVVWGKIIMWISKKGFLQLKIDYYDEDDFLVKTMKGSQIKQLGGRLIPTYWEMIPVDEPGQKTVLEYLDIEFNKKIRTNFFSQQNMKRVR